jgi:hypothetical protein
MPVSGLDTFAVDIFYLWHRTQNACAGETPFTTDLHPDWRVVSVSSTEIS